MLAHPVQSGRASMHADADGAEVVKAGSPIAAAVPSIMGGVVGWSAPVVEQRWQLDRHVDFMYSLYSLVGAQ
jgi:hypothetical protein